MTPPTRLRREDVFRDAKSWYGTRTGTTVSPELLRFCRQHAGRRILDVGCATGDYCLALRGLGYDCEGVDKNEAYVKTARERGVAAFSADIPWPFCDAAFDTALMFEVLEHVPDPEPLLREAKRVAAKNILLTVPDCGGFASLRERGLTYSHFLDADHVNFFTKAELEHLLARHFTRFTVVEREPIWGTVGLPWWLRKPVALLYRLGLVSPRIFYRLYAVVELAAA